jgi:hypothetical protein
MRTKALPDWFAPLFGWLITAIVWGASWANRPGVYVNRDLLWFPPLLAVAWTSGYLGMLRFKTRFRREYESLGSPQMFGSPYDGDMWRFQRYLFGFRFLRLSDLLVSIAFAVFVGLTVIGIVLFLAYLGHV